MRSVRYHEAGPPSCLQLDEIDRPTAAAHEILVKVYAASINPTDAKRRRRGAGPFPKTTGSDFTGVVEAVGSDVSEFNPGDRVCGTGLHTTRFHQGSFSEYVAVPTDVVSKLPDAVSFEDGAAVALVGVTAWRGLIDHGGLVPTDTVLIHGGTGGVGHIAVQLADLLSGHIVATAHPDRKQDASSFGADRVVEYTQNDLEQVLPTLFEDGFDVVFDHRTYEYFTTDIEAAAFSGNIVCYGGVKGNVEFSHEALKKNLSIHAMTMSNLATATETPSISSVLDRVLDLTEQSKLSPMIARTYTLDEAVEAHRAILEDSFVGKLIITVP